MNKITEREIEWKYTDSKLHYRVTALKVYPDRVNATIEIQGDDQGKHIEWELARHLEQLSERWEEHGQCSQEDGKAGEATE